MLYEAIFHGQTSATQLLANKAAWIINLPFDENERQEPDKVSKFSAGCIRLSTAANEIELFVTNDLTRLNFEILKNDAKESSELAKANSIQWQKKKTKDLQKIRSLKNTFDWNAIFNGTEKECLFKIVSILYQNNLKFKAAVDNVAAYRSTYITEFALKKDVQYSSADEMLKKFINYVLEEECAGMLALRFKSYTDIFYLDKLNYAMAETANMTISSCQIEPEKVAGETPQKEAQEKAKIEETKINEIINQINKTTLKFHTLSQYKPVEKKQTNGSHKPTKKEKPSLHLYHLHTSNAVGIDKAALYKAFFDSKEIPLESKLQTFEKLAGSTSHLDTYFDKANGDDCEYELLSEPEEAASPLPNNHKNLRNGKNFSPAVD